MSMGLVSSVKTEAASAGNGHARTKEWQAFIHLLKGYIGPGCLSLPWAFSQLGVLGGCLSCVVLSYWTSYNCWAVVKIKRSFPQEVVTFPDAGTWAYGPVFGHVVRFFICILQLSICTVFLSFVGTNLLAFWMSTNPPATTHILVITVVLPAAIGMSCMASLRSMAPFSAGGTIFLVTTFSLLATAIVEDWPTRPEHPPTLNLVNSPLAICALLYSFEGICLILPIEESMERPKNFTVIFWTCMWTVCAVFCLVASLSVLAFGRVTNGSITAYLLSQVNEGNKRFLLLAAANTAASLSVFLTYPLQLFPAIELIGPFLSKKPTQRGNTVPTEEEPVESNEAEEAKVEEGNEETEAFQDELSPQEEDSPRVNPHSGIQGDSPKLRLVLVMTTFVLAIAVPNVQLLISLVGAFAGSATALLIPPLLELEYIKRTQPTNTFGKVRCYFLFVLGFVFFSIGTGYSLTDIVRAYLRR